MAVHPRDLESHYYAPNYDFTVEGATFHVFHDRLFKMALAQPNQNVIGESIIRDDHLFQNASTSPVPKWPAVKLEPITSDEYTGISRVNLQEESTEQVFRPADVIKAPNRSSRWHDIGRIATKILSFRLNRMLPDIDLPSFVPRAERVSSDKQLRILQPSNVTSLESKRLIDDYMKLRFAYVQEEGWNTGNTVDDADGYDGNPRTQIILTSRSDERGDQNLVAGARFTRVPTIESSLTYQMLSTNPMMKDSARIKYQYALADQAGASGRLYDLTRWVTDRHNPMHDKVALLTSVLQIMAAGLEATREEGKPPVWVFLTGPEMKNVLDKYGIATTVLAEGKVSEEDEHEAYLCLVYPEEALYRMRHSNDRRHTRAIQTIDSAINTLGASLQVGA